MRLNPFDAFDLHYPEMPRLGAASWKAFILGLIAWLVAPLVILGFALAIAAVFGALDSALEELDGELSLGSWLTVGLRFIWIFPLFGWIAGLVAALRSDTHKRALWSAFGANLALWLLSVTVTLAG